MSASSSSVTVMMDPQSEMVISGLVRMPAYDSGRVKKEMLNHEAREEHEDSSASLRELRTLPGSILLFLSTLPGARPPEGLFHAQAARLFIPPPAGTSRRPRQVARRPSLHGLAVLQHRARFAEAPTI